MFYFTKTTSHMTTYYETITAVRSIEEVISAFSWSIAQ